MILSISNISPTHGSYYYTKEGNYLDLYDCSNWHGKLIQTLDLPESVESHPLACLLRGRSPTGETLIDKSRLHSRSTQDQIKERAGIDLTTSAPKSVSIQALVFGDRKLEDAHQTATIRMLNVLEERYAITRQMQNGKRQKVITGQLAIAQFHHDTSRELDPQLHTHNIILNLQRLPSGQWRSLDNAAIYQTKMLLGQIYRNELAQEVQRLGYEIQVTNYRLGLWELKGYSSQQLKAFSKRSQQIQQQAGDDASSEHKAWIAISSGRKTKQQVTRQELEALWKEDAISVGLHPIVAQAPRETARSGLTQAITYATIDYLSQHSTVFPREEIERIALTQIGQISFAALRTAIDQHPNLTIHLNEKGQQQCTYQNLEISHDSTSHDIWGLAQQDCADSTPRVRSDRSESAEALEQFRQDLRTLAATCPGISTERSRLAGVEPFDSSDCRATGAPATMAETASDDADSTETTARKSSEVDQSCKHGGQQSDDAIPGGIDRATGNGNEQPNPKTEEPELERDRHH
ncbi:MAG: relaxase domain-containing protein [Phormidium tanganyikae FI6-MK23]|jgi:conjugative relaxase-like TrwC/TraI family protein|nr:relaxase domain-containing protein [Phormidium tanganyikae FI6-MK23]